MELTTQALEAMKGNSRLMNLIAAELDCSESTVRRWIHANDEMLTTASALKIISEETGIKQKDLLTEKTSA